MTDRAFPSVYWPDMAVTATFLAEPRILAENNCSAVIAFAWTGDRFLLANIAGRGWCTPSGRVEPGESASDAAVRETSEEAGASLIDPIPLGVYQLRQKDGSDTLVAACVGFAPRWDPAKAGSESVGVGAFTPGKLSSVYYRWDDLLEAVFALAREVAEREFGRMGTHQAGSSEIPHSGIGPVK